MTRPVLYDTISRLQQNFGSIIQFQIDFSGKDQIEVHCIGGVHGGVHRFYEFRQSRQLLLQFGKGRGGIRVLGKLVSIRRQLRNIVASPDPMKLEPRQ